MIRAAGPEETAIVRESLEAVQRGLYDAFLSGKRLAMVGRRVVLVDEAVLALPPELLQGTDIGDDQRLAAGGSRDARRGDGPDAGRRDDGAGAGDAERAAQGVDGRGGAERVADGTADDIAGGTADGTADGIAGGLPVGLLDDGFALDLQGAIIMARETRRQSVRVNEKAARLFLYGRNILGTSILGFDPSLRPGDHCIVTNPRNEALGIGRVVGSFKAPRTAVEPVHDLGSYLRDE